MTNQRLLSADIDFGADKQENIIHSLRNYFQSGNIEATKDTWQLEYALRVDWLAEAAADACNHAGRTPLELAGAMAQARALLG